MSFAARAIGGVLGGLSGRRGAKRAGEHAGKVAQSKGMISYTNFGRGSQVGQLADKTFGNAMRDPAELARQQSEFAKRQFADSMNLMTQRGQQNMVGRGFENMTDSQTGLQRAVLSRMMSPQAQMFADNMANQMGSAVRYQDSLANQAFQLGHQQHDQIGGMMGQSSAAGSGNPMMQGLFAGVTSGMNYLDARNQMNQANAMQNRMMNMYEADRDPYSKMPMGMRSL